LLTRIDDWQAVAAVHGEFFRDIRPANTIMQVVPHPRILIAARLRPGDWV
jgi:hypothetical protein